MPSFWLGIMLILLLAGVLNILPTAGRSTYGIAGPETTGFYLLDSLFQRNWKAVWDALTHICMPALALGVNMLGILMRVTRSSVLEVMNEEYVVTARAKGLAEKNIVWRHVTSNALIPVITVVGLELGTLLSGSIIVETVFAWPGVGSLLITALNARDYPLVTGIVMTYTAAFVVINLIIDGLMQSLTLESATEKTPGLVGRLAPRLHAKAFTGGLIVLTFIVVGILGPALAPL